MDKRIDKTTGFVVVSAVLGLIVLTMQGISYYRELKRDKKAEEEKKANAGKIQEQEKLTKLQVAKTQLEIASLNQQVPASLRIPQSEYLNLN